MYTIKPIGYMKSPFTFKNGTPRQQSICQQAKGIITIEKNIFNNPEHSLEGLHEFSHVWIFFVFHKNNNAHTKAKVKPPRLNGKKTGVFSTRSPYRPNNIGLTLAKIEDISGASLTVSGIDILDGTPIVDIKPYIPQYDYPGNTRHSRETDSMIDTDTGNIEAGANIEMEGDADIGAFGDGNIENIGNADNDTACDAKVDSDGDIVDTVMISSPEGVIDELKVTGADEVLNKNESHACSTSKFESSSNMVSGKVKVIDNIYYTNSTTCQTPDVHLEVATSNTDEKTDTPSQNHHYNQNGLKENISNDRSDEMDKYYVHSDCLTAEWLNKASGKKLIVRWTPSAEEQIKQFSNAEKNSDYKLNFSKSCDEAKLAIMNILHEDPRSTYRRKHCIDQLYYFTYDIIHVTCWFDDNFVEIVRVKSVNHVEKLCERNRD